MTTHYLLASDRLIKKIKTVHSSRWFEVLEQFNFTYYCHLLVMERISDYSHFRPDSDYFWAIRIRHFIVKYIFVSNPTPTIVSDKYPTIKFRPNMAYFGGNCTIFGENLLKFSEKHKNFNFFPFLLKRYRIFKSLLYNCENFLEKCNKKVKIWPHLCGLLAIRYLTKIFDFLSIWLRLLALSILSDPTPTFDYLNIFVSDF